MALVPAPRFTLRPFTTTLALLLAPVLANAQTTAPAKVAQPKAEPGLQLREAPKSAMVTDPLVSQAGGLTSGEVAKRVMAVSPLVAGRQAQIEAAAAKVEQAKIQFVPRPTFKGTYARLSPAHMTFGGDASMVMAGNSGPLVVGACPPGLPASQCALDSKGQPVVATPIKITPPETSYAFSAQLGIPLSDYLLKLSKTLASVNANKRSAEYTKVAEELKAGLDAANAYYNWTRGVAGVAVAEASLTRVQALQKDAQSAFSAGASTKADVLRVDALVASTELSLVNARTMRTLAAEQMAVLMNMPVADWKVGEDIRSETAQMPKRPELSALVDQAFQRRMELRAAVEGERALEKSASATRMGAIPRVDAFGQYDYAKPNQRYTFDATTWHQSWMVGATLSWTITDSFLNTAQGREIDANRRKTLADIENLKQGLHMDVTSAYLDEQKAQVALVTAQRGLQSAQEAYRAATELYRVGRATTTDLIAAEQELLSASLNEINAAIDARVATIRLNHAIGQDAPENT
jgi:outer membrane protein TolC